MRPTPSQTVGPFFRFGLEWLESGQPRIAENSGIITIYGRVLDGEGQAVPDALVELYQEGSPSDSGSSFYRRLVDEDGRFELDTLMPISVDADQAPHLDVNVFARGLMQRLVTRVYFEGQDANRVDPILNLVHESRRQSLVAKRTDRGFEFDIRLQGDRETVFFAW